MNGAGTKAHIERCHVFSNEEDGVYVREGADPYIVGCK